MPREDHTQPTAEELRQAAEIIHRARMTFPYESLSLEYVRQEALNAGWIALLTLAQELEETERRRAKRARYRDELAAGLNA